MRTITVSEITPGMRVRWEYKGVKTELTVAQIAPSSMAGSLVVSPEGAQRFVPEDVGVTVLDEPQPLEPTEFGALVVADGVEYLRWDVTGQDTRAWVSRERVASMRFHSWDQITGRGHVRVIPLVRRDTEEEN